MRANITLKQVVVWTSRIVAAVIMLQTLYFKFSGAEESVYIFSTIGMEPWGRIGTGVMELLASALLLIPAVSVLGALLGIGLMSGALFFHLTKLGIEVMHDRGELFYLALITAVCCLLVLIADHLSVMKWYHKGISVVKNKSRKA